MNTLCMQLSVLSYIAGWANNAAVPASAMRGLYNVHTLSSTVASTVASTHPSSIRRRAFDFSLQLLNLLLCMTTEALTET